MGLQMLPLCQRLPTAGPAPQAPKESTAKKGLLQGLEQKEDQSPWDSESGQVQKQLTAYGRGQEDRRQADRGARGQRDRRMGAAGGRGRQDRGWEEGSWACRLTVLGSVGPPARAQHCGGCVACSSTEPRRPAGARLTSHLPRRPVSCSRDQMLWILPACSGWLVVLPHAHWCFSISVSYTRPAVDSAAATIRAAGRGPWLPPTCPRQQPGETNHYVPRSDRAAFCALGPLVRKRPVRQRPKGAPGNGRRRSRLLMACAQRSPGGGGASQEERREKTPHATPCALSCGALMGQDRVVLQNSAFSPRSQSLLSGHSLSMKPCAGLSPIRASGAQKKDETRFLP